MTTFSNPINWPTGLVVTEAIANQQFRDNELALKELINTINASKAAANGLASLNASSLVVQNPNNATATPTASKIVISDANGRVTGWMQPISSQLYITAAGMTPQTTNGCDIITTIVMGTSKQDIQVLLFDKDAVEYAQTKLFRMPSDYNGGVVTYSIDWEHGATNTNFKVAWKVDAVAYANDDALDHTWGTAIQVNDTGGTTTDYYATDVSGNLTIGGSPAANRLTIIRVQRLATDGTNDTLAIDAGFIGIQINYTRNV